MRASSWSGNDKQLQVGGVGENCSPHKTEHRDEQLLGESPRVIYQGYIRESEQVSPIDRDAWCSSRIHLEKMKGWGRKRGVPHPARLEANESSVSSMGKARYTETSCTFQGNYCRKYIGNEYTMWCRKQKEMTHSKLSPRKRSPIYIAI
jgi:hypothetical protein